MTMFPCWLQTFEITFKKMDNQIPETKGGHLWFLELKKLEIFERN